VETMVSLVRVLLSHCILVNIRLVRMTAGNILRMSYGYKVGELRDPWVARAERILQLIQDLGTLGTHPVDVFPICTC
jgi:hypothetical protein